MAEREYWMRPEGGYDFTELKDDPNFIDDLAVFLQGGRYKFSDDELMEMGRTGMFDRFVEHMRSSTVNELTAVRDLTYLTNKRQPEEGKAAYGRLVEAWHRSDQVGSGFTTGLLDFVEGAATSPTTLFTLATLGGGVMSKLAGRGVSAASSTAVQRILSQYVMKGATKQAAAAAVRQDAGRRVTAAAGKGFMARRAEQQLAAQMLRETPRHAGREFLPSVLHTAKWEIPVEAIHNYAEGKSREKSSPTGYEYSGGQWAADTAITAGAGMAFGGALGMYAGNRRNKVFDSLFEATLARREGVLAARKNANAAIARAIRIAPEKTKVSIEKGVDELIALDPELVAGGDALREKIIRGVMDGTEMDMPIMSNLPLDTVRSLIAGREHLKAVVAAGGELDPGLSFLEQAADYVPREADERITKWFARMTTEHPETFTDQMQQFREIYGLTPKEVGMIYMSEVSEAAKTLRGQRTVQDFFGNQLKVVKKLKSTGAADVPSPYMLQMEKGSKGRYAGDKIVEFLNNLDATQIAAMTTQLGTASANTMGSGLALAAHFTDQSMISLLRFAKGDFNGGRAAIKGLADHVRAVSMSADEVQALAFRIRADRPDLWSEFFHETVRADKAVAYDSIGVRLARKANIFNSASDGAFKRHMFYVSLERSLRESPDAPWRSVREFIKSGSTVDQIPNNLFQKAMNDSLRVTMQRGWADDMSKFGQAFGALERLNKKVPFVSSQGLGLPFPRFMGNMIEMTGDYTGVGLMYGMGDKALRKLGGNGFWMDPAKTMEERAARALTGFVAGAAFYQMAAMRPEGTKYSVIMMGDEGEGSGGYDLKRGLGPFIAIAYLSDLMYRLNHDMPVRTTISTAVEDLKDMGYASDMGVQGSVLYYLASAYDNPDDPVTMAKLAGGLGDYFSTFTYPVTPLRDIVGQIDGDSAPTPYSRNLIFDDLEGMMFWDQFKLSVTKNLPDVKWGELMKSRGQGDFDLPKPDPLRPEAVNQDYPAARQMGVQDVGASNSLTLELGRLQIAEYKAWGRAHPNPTIDYVERQMAGSTLPEAFELWRDNIQLDNGLTYDNLSDKQKPTYLLEFISDYRGNIEDTIYEFRRSQIYSGEAGRVRKYASHINWEYAELRRRFERSHPEAFDTIAREAFGYNTAEEFILDVDDGAVDGSGYVESLNRKLMLLETVGKQYGARLDFK